VANILFLSRSPLVATKTYRSLCLLPVVVSTLCHQNPSAGSETSHILFLLEVENEAFHTQPFLLEVENETFHIHPSLLVVESETDDEGGTYLLAEDCDDPEGGSDVQEAHL